VEDFIVDDASWAIRSSSSTRETGGSGKKVPGCTPMDRPASVGPNPKVFVGLSRASDQAIAEIHRSILIDRDFETRLYGHYSRHGYWVDESALGHGGLPLIRRRGKRRRAQNPAAITAD